MVIQVKAYHLLFAIGPQPIGWRAERLPDPEHDRARADHGPSYTCDL